MNIKSLLLLPLAILILYACNEKKINNVREDNIITTRNQIIKITNDVFNSTIDLNTLIQEFDYTPLETKNECLIGSINKLLISKDSYIIHDKDNSKIFRFNKEGRYMNQIGIVGNGPHEYKEAYDVSLSTNNDISVLDLKGRKIIIYRLDGSYLNEIKIKFLFTQHEYFDNKLVCNIYKSENPLTPSINGYKLVVSDSLNNVMSEAIKYKINKSNTYTVLNPLRNFCGKIFFNDPFHNRIIGVGDRGIFQEFTIVYEDNLWDKNINFDILDDQAIKQTISENTYMDGDYVMADNFLYFSLLKKNKRADIFYSIKNNSFIGGSSFLNEKNRMELLSFKSPRWCDSDGTFVSLINPYQLIQFKDYILEGGMNNLSAKEKRIILNSKEDDNPILIFYKLNQF